MIGKSISFTWDLDGMFNLFLESGLLAGGKENDNPDKQSFSHLWIRLVTTQMKRSLMTVTPTLRKYITKLIGNTIEMPYFG